MLLDPCVRLYSDIQKTNKQLEELLSFPSKFELTGEVDLKEVLTEISRRQIHISVWNDASSACVQHCAYPYCDLAALSFLPTVVGRWSSFLPLERLCLHLGLYIPFLNLSDH